MALAEAIDELAELDLDRLGDAEVHARLVELERQSQRLEAAKALLVMVWDARQIWADDGSKAPGARLARDAHRSPKATRREVRRARRLRTMVPTADAFDAGAISVEHVDVLIDANAPAVADLFARDEQLLVSYASDLPFDDFTRAVAYWAQVADDDGAEDRAEARRAGRRAACARTMHGVRDVTARLDPIGGAIFETELARLERIEFEADWAAARAVHGDRTQLDHLARTSAQRRADALVEMAKRSAAMPADAKRGRVLCSVLLGYETATGRLCELLDGTVVTPGQLIPHLDATDVERIVFDGASRVIDVGRRTPFFTGALRRAIEIRDRHCTFPGCRVPAEACDVDHIVERCDGGTTTQENGRLLCPTHNRQRPGRTAPPRGP